MEIGLSLTRWSIGASFALYVIAVAIQLSRPAPNPWRSLAAWSSMSRLLWTAACLLLFAHVGLAFAFVHHGSHTAAYQETARQTAKLTGIRSGFGLYINYLMLVAWLGHVIGLWSPTLSKHPSWATANRWINVFFGFMWLNATVVFGDGLIRWAGVAGFLIMLFVRMVVRPARDRRSMTRVHQP